jgi:hypothetical protein
MMAGSKPPTRARMPLGWRFLLPCAFVSGSMHAGRSASLNVPATESRLYVMMSTESGWVLADADIATGTLPRCWKGVSGSLRRRRALLLWQMEVAPSRAGRGAHLYIMGVCR